MDDEETGRIRPAATANPDYAQRQLAAAFRTALAHEDAGTRERAERRVERWRAVLGGMADGSLQIGSRTPVAGLPAWVTPEVVRGGFATGAPAAGGPLEPYEEEAARRGGLPAERGALFAYALTEGGFAELEALLDSGAYEVRLPEEAALLTVVWLLRNGDRGRAVELLDEIEPFAGQLRFWPRPGQAAVSGGDSSCVHRRTAGQARAVVAARPLKPAIAAMNEALIVWNPFADELLVHWLESTDDGGRILARLPVGGWEPWYGRGRALLARYRELAAAHPHCGKHRRPQGNLAILRAGLEGLQPLADGGQPALGARQRGLVQHAVDSMVRRRGAPGSPAHAALRARQAADGARPTHHALAQLVARRLSGLQVDAGLPRTEPYVAPVTDAEQADTGLPAGTRIPVAIRKAVEGALSAPVETLMERGVVPSADVLAELVPQLVAHTTALGYADPTVRTLMAATYRAFRNRRSLLLLNLEHQVTIDELPWVRAVSDHRGGPDPRTGLRRPGRDEARTVLRQLGELALHGFPAAILPNPLISELVALSKAAGLKDVPWTEELAADIFMGTFTGKFLRAAQEAGELLSGSLYERYYGIDYAAVSGLATPTAFAGLCTERADSRGPTDGWSVAANGAIVEQAQILTTHNLATLVRHASVAPTPGWTDLARRSFTTACLLTSRLAGNARPLPMVKNAAYAWRQFVFYLSMATPEERAAVLAWLDEDTADHRAAALAPAINGLRMVAAGGAFGADGTAEGGRSRRLLGWTTAGHWLLPEGRT
ncbi:hypothetical protein [Streptomyces boninensis]|uniref:hypothetical protein n=1 Tax=Streptomyces boninensis TaxID=2039455 RepID=UPI003B21AF9D